MSAPIETRASETPSSGQLPASGAPAPVPAAGPAATTPAPEPTVGKGTPGFDHERDAKEWRSRYDKRESELRPVLQTIQRLGLDPVRGANALENFERVLQNPELRPLVLQVLNGGKPELPKPTAAPEPTSSESWVDPDLKALEERIEAKYGGTIASLTRELDELRQTTRASASAQVTSKLQGYEREFLGAYPMLSEEERADFGRRFLERFDWMAKNSPAALLDLERNTYRNMALPILDEAVQGGILGLSERVLAQRAAGLAGRATDARSRAQTTGHETPPTGQTFERTPTPHDLQRVAHEAIERLRREKGYSGPITNAR